MRFVETPLAGAYLIEPEPKGDERGFFARIYCAETFAKMGLEGNFVQANNSFSPVSGTLRGLHYQLTPYGEDKLVRCISGSLYDIILDLRLDSSTFGVSFGATLSAANRTMLYVPKGFAHGFITLEPGTEVIYLVSAPYAPSYERGIRWDDPAFAISWPRAPQLLSERDASHPDFALGWHLTHPPVRGAEGRS